MNVANLLIQFCVNDLNLSGLNYIMLIAMEYFKK
jgi:hypothetical protein